MVGTPGRSIGWPTWPRAGPTTIPRARCAASTTSGGRLDVPLRRLRRRGRGRHRDRPRGVAPADHRRRRRHDAQPAARRRPGARWRGPGRRPGAVRGVRLRPRRQPPHRHPSPTTPSRRPRSCRRSRGRCSRPRRPTTSWAPRASPSPAPSACPPAVQNAVVDALATARREARRPALHAPAGVAGAAMGGRTH